jgi:hypothetical protein
MITEADKAALIRQDDPTLAEWYCLLNGWQWPAELPDPETLEYRAGSRRGLIMDWIGEMVGNRLCSRVWNKGMTDQEFEDFWNGTALKDPAARARYDQYLERYGQMMVRLHSVEFDVPLV